MNSNGSGSLKGQVAVVTGAGRGIGAAIALRLAGLGANVVLCGRTLKTLQATAEGIAAEGGRAEAVTCDVRDLGSVQTLAAKVEQTFGRIDILVNNAGIGGFAGPLHEMTPEAWEKILNTNLRGVFYCIRTFAPVMIRRGGGHIVNISSLAGKNPLPNGAAYAASKWGLNGLSYSVAEELRGDNMRGAGYGVGTVVLDMRPDSV